MQGFISGLLHSIAPSCQYHPVLIIIGLQCFEIRKWDLHFVLFQNCFSRESLVAQRLKRLPAMRETWLRSLSWEDLWRRKWQPTPVFLPGESHGGKSLVGYSLRGHKESDTTELLHFHFPWWSSGSTFALLRARAEARPKTTTKNVLAIWDPLRFLMSFRMHVPISTKSATGVLTDCWIYRSLWVVWTS